MKIHSKLLAFSLTAIAAIGLASCSTSNGGGNYVNFEGDPTKISAKVTFWHTMGQENQEILNRIIEGFNEIYPNITIEHASQGGYDDIRDKISKAIPAGTTPTMAFCYPDHVAEYLASGAIEQMDGYVSDPIIGLGKEAHDSKGGAEDFLDAFWNEGKEYGSQYGVEGALYSLPYAKSTEVMFYNKDYFSENNLTVPTTWDEMETVMKQIKTLNPEDKIRALGYDSDANFLITRFEQDGIPYTSLDPNNHFLFNNDEAKGLVSKLKEWYDEGYLITSGSSSNNSYTSNMFIGESSAECQVVMTIGSTGGTRYNYSSHFEVGVAPIPGGSENNHVISQGPSVCFFSRASATEKYAAWLFYKYATNTENSAAYAISTGYSPVRKSSFNCDSFLKFTNVPSPDGKERLFQQTLKFNSELTELYFTSPAFKGSSTARSSMDGILANVLLGTKTIEQAFDDALTDCLFAS